MFSIFLKTIYFCEVELNGAGLFSRAEFDSEILYEPGPKLSYLEKLKSN
jgi:hypothetical protein